MTAFRMPPLPSGWPYQPRTPLPPWVRREGQDLGPLGPEWTVWGPERLALQGPLEPLGGAFGRGGVARLGDMVVRPYRRGGLVRFVNERTYPTPTRFQEEGEVHRALWEAGLPTVEPLGCAWRRRGWGVEGLYFTRWIQAQPWPRTFAIEAWPQVEAILDALGAWGCWVPDLNATNLLLDPEGRVLALDFDRARFAGGNLRTAYLQRLARSMRKLRAPDTLTALVEPRT